jgi:hypothetical protein
MLVMGQDIAKVGVEMVAGIVHLEVLQVVVFSMEIREGPNILQTM